MSKISEQIRAAALGPAPRALMGTCFIGMWLQDLVLRMVVAPYRGPGESFVSLCEEDQRLFLLEVAESLE